MKVLFLLLLSQLAVAGTYVVYLGQSIHSAVSNARYGDTVLLKDGSYIYNICNGIYVDIGGI